MSFCLSGLFGTCCFERRQSSMRNKRRQADQIFRYLIKDLGLWMCALINCSFNLVILLKMSFFMYQICHAWIGVLGLWLLGQATSVIVSITGDCTPLYLFNSPGIFVPDRFGYLKNSVQLVLFFQITLQIIFFA